MSTRHLRCLLALSYLALVPAVPIAVWQPQVGYPLLSVLVLVIAVLMQIIRSRRSPL